uniref:Integrase core domain containing protein n=1 Tax=Solanum tuberosum TaxID=4113 RepID=M1DG46_SOLTU
MLGIECCWNERNTENGPSVSPRWASRTVGSSTDRETPCGPHLEKKEYIGLGEGFLKERRHVVITQGKSEYPIVCHFIVLHSNGLLYFSGTMAPQRKNTTKHSSPTASQSEGHNDFESSSSKVHINTTIEDHSPRATRAQTRGQFSRTLIPNLKRKFVDGSGGSSEFASGSQEDTTTPPSAVNTEAETGAQEKAGVVGEYEDITNDDTMVLYVNINEVDPAKRQQLIDCFLFMWTVNRSEEFFNNGIVNKSGGFKKRSIMHETRTLRQLNVGRRKLPVPGPLNSIFVRGTSIDISEDTINRMLHGPEYTAPTSVDLFEGKHHAVTSDTKIEVQSSRERVLRWIASEITLDRENAVWVTTTPTLITKASLFLQPRGPDQGESSQPSTEAPPPPTSASQAPGTFVTIPILFLEILVADQCQTRTLVDQIVHRTPQLIDRDVLTVEKKIKDEMRKELAVLKDRMDGLEILNQDRL